MTSKRSKQRRRGKNKARNRVQNASIVSASGAGQRQDLTSSARVDRATSHPLDRSASDYIRAREWAQLYYKEWTARKIVNIPVEDMLRKGWKYEDLDEDQSKFFTAKLRNLGFFRALKQALRMERLVGGSIILLGVKDEKDNPELPLDLNAVKEGDLIFTNVIPRTKVSSYEYNQNPLSPEFGKPELYTVWQSPVHKSRMMIFDGDPLTDNEVNDLGFVNRSFDGFGVSVLSALWSDIIRSIGARQAAAQLIERASVLLIQNDSMRGMLESDSNAGAIEKLNAIADQMSIYQAAMLDGKNVTLDQWSAQFGSVPQLLEQFLIILAAGSDIPATRFLGQAPGGLNATGKSDLENYYNMIAAHQEDRLKPQLNKLLQVGLRSFLPNVDPEKVDIEFEPLWNPSELEDSQVRTADANNVYGAFDRGMVTTEEARDELTVKGIFETELKDDALAELEADGEEEEELSVEEQIAKLMSPA